MFSEQIFLNSFDMLNIISLSLSFQVYLFDINNGIFSFLWSHVQSLSRFYSRVCSIHAEFLFIFFFVGSSFKFYVLRNITAKEEVNAFRTHAEEIFSHNNTEGCTSS
jgi:hypothetical protein